MCLAVLPPAGLSRTRYLCKRLRARWPDLRILVGRWTAESGEENAEVLLAAGADAVHTTLLDTRDEIWRLLEARASAPTAPALISPARVRGAA